VLIVLVTIIYLSIATKLASLKHVHGRCHALSFRQISPMEAEKRPGCFTEQEKCLCYWSIATNWKRLWERWDICSFREIPIMVGLIQMKRYFVLQIRCPSLLFQL